MLEPDAPAHPVWMELDLGALAGNYAEIRRRFGPDGKVIAAIKANAYGNSAIDVARTLGDLGVYALATASFADALAVREAGIETRLLMFGGPLPAAMPDLLRHGLIPTVYNMDLAQSVSAAATAPTPVYVKVDTGMGRLGVPVERAKAFILDIAGLPNLLVEGVYTHASFFEAEDAERSRQRIAAFDALLADLAAAGLEVPVTQAIASSSLLAGITSTANAICPGHLLYGVSSVAPGVGDMTGFRPVLREIGARLIHVGHPAGQPDRTVGVVPIGLYQGYRNPLADAPVAMLFRGRRVPVTGVSLEYTKLDLTGIDAPALGEEVIVIGERNGESIRLEDVGAWQGARAHEVLMAFDQRLPCRVRAVD